MLKHHVTAIALVFSTTAWANPLQEPELSLPPGQVCVRAETFCAHQDDLILEADVLAVDHDSGFGTLVTLTPVEVFKGKVTGDTVSFLMSLQVRRTATDLKNNRATLGISGGPGDVYLTPGERILVFLNRSNHLQGPWAGQYHVSTNTQSLFRRHDSGVAGKYLAVSQDQKIVAETQCDHAILSAAAFVHKDELPARGVIAWKHGPYADVATEWTEFMSAVGSCKRASEVGKHCDLSLNTPPDLTSIFGPLGEGQISNRSF